jgi:protein-S-isoprenylcysteine O-methyltransferase Ste14
MIKPVLFVFVSILIVMFSWPYLSDRRSHGFYRFFAFECILALVLLGSGRWFQEPFIPRQILSWLLLLGSLFMALHGFFLLVARGKPQGSFENTTRLVTVGAYRYIRHPLYASLLLLTWGAFLKQPDLLNSALMLAATAFLIATTRMEEAENLAHFGEEYAHYMSTTKMFIPWLL